MRTTGNARLVRRSRRLAVTAAVAAVALLVAGCAGQGKGPSSTGATDVRIGLSYPMTGQFADYGVLYKNGTAIAKEDLAREGIKVAYTSGNAADAATGTTTLNQLISDRIKLAAVATSDAILAQVPVAERSDVLLVNFIGTSPKFRGLSKNLLSLPPSGADDARAIVKKLADEGVKTVAMIYPNDAQGTAAVPATEKTAKDTGIEIVSSQQMQGTDTDVRAQLIRMKDAKPDAVLVWACGQGTGYVLRQAQEVGLTPSAGFWTQSGCLTSPDLYKIAGKAADGLRGPQVAFTGKVGERFQEEYRKKFDSEAPVAAGYIYDAVIALATAVHATGSDDPTTVREWLTGHSVEVSTGTLTFDDEGVAIRKTAFYTVRDGKPVADR